MDNNVFQFVRPRKEARENQNRPGSYDWAKSIVTTLLQLNRLDSAKIEQLRQTMDSDDYMLFVANITADFHLLMRNPTMFHVATGIRYRKFPESNTDHSLLITEISLYTDQTVFLCEDLLTIDQERHARKLFFDIGKLANYTEAQINEKLQLLDENIKTFQQAINFQLVRLIATHKR